MRGRLKKDEQSHIILRFKILPLFSVDNLSFTSWEHCQRPVWGQAGVRGKHRRLQVSSWRSRYTILHLSDFKGAQAWDIRERFFYMNPRLMVRWLRDWRKKLKFRKLESFFKGLRRKILIKRTISMRLITKKISR